MTVGRSSAPAPTKRLILWNIATPMEPAVIDELANHRHWVHGLAVNSDLIATASYDDTVILWRFVTSPRP
jgi:WD40 repeat protein